MANDLRLLVLIPAWNEEESVGDVAREASKRVPEADVLVVDDGSTDNTARVARSEGAAVLSLPFNLGVGGAMRAGYRYAERGGYDVVVQVDADGQHAPSDIPLLLDALEGADLVIGSRFAGSGTYAVKGPRRWAMRLLAWRLSKLAGTRLTDTTSGFRAANRRTIALFAREYPVEYLGDTVESVVTAAQMGLRVREVAVAMRPRIAGAPSQSPWRATIYLFRAALILVLAAIRRRPKGPTPTDAPEDAT
jgi:glycosyltransferase involved in cell wall biosynthesis